MKTRRYNPMRKKHTRKRINRRRNMTKKRKEVFVRNNNVTRRKSLNGGELDYKQKMYYVSGLQQFGIHLLLNGSSLSLTPKEKKEIKIIYHDRESNFMTQLGEDPMPVYQPNSIVSTDDDYVLFKYFRKNLKKETLADLIRESRDTDKKLNPDTIAMVGMARLLISKKFFRSRLKPIFTLFKETYPDYLTVFRIKEPEQIGEPEKEEEEKEEQEEEPEKEPEPEKTA